MIKKTRVIVNIIACFFLFTTAASSRDIFSLSFPSKDTTDKEITLANREARKATVFSAVLPGLGQAYNHKYWKIPLIYGAAGGFTYFAITNNSTYKTYSNALRWRYDDDPSTIDEFPDFSDDNLILLKNKYKRWRDLSFIGIGAVYIFNIIDANVDAHLKHFDEKINEKITMSVRPCSNVMTTFDRQVYYSGLKIRLQF